MRQYCRQMEAVRLLVAAVVLIVTQVRPSEAIRCYSCIADRLCSDFANSSSISTCNGEACMKFKGEFAGLSIVYRDCVSSSELSVSIGCKSDSYLGFTGTLCYCQADLCNDAPALLPPFWKAITILATVPLIRMSC